PRALAGTEARVAARRPLRRCASRDAEAPRAARAGAVHAPRRGERPRAARRGRRPRAGHVSVAAQVAAVVGSVGLGALLLARGRWHRLAGLAAWAAGIGVLDLYLL